VGAVRATGASGVRVVGVVRGVRGVGAEVITASLEPGARVPFLVFEGGKYAWRTF
jgi:hypothetical protein